MRNKILLEEKMMLFSPELAKIIGLEESIILQYIHKCLLENEEKGVNYIEDRYWIAKSIKSWHKEVFYFWSESIVKRLFLSLQRKGLLIGCKFTKEDFDHTKWYTIDYDELDSVIHAARNKK